MKKTIVSSKTRRKPQKYDAYGYEKCIFAGQGIKKASTAAFCGHR